MGGTVRTELSTKVENTKKWLTFNSSSGKFSILFPDDSIHVYNRTELDKHNKETIIHCAEWTLDKGFSANQVYRIDYTFLSNVETEKQVDEFFSRQLKSLAEVGNVDYAHKKNSKYGDYIDVLITLDTKKCHYRMYYYDGIYYKLTVISKPDFPLNAAVFKFLDSFKIHKIPASN